MRAQIPDEAEADRQAQTLGADTRVLTLCEIRLEQREILVVAENFRDSELIQRPDLCSDEALRAILVHEASSISTITISFTSTACSPD